MDYIAMLLITSSQFSIEITDCDTAVVTSEVSPKPSFTVASLALLVESQAVEIWAVFWSKPSSCSVQISTLVVAGFPRQAQAVAFQHPLLPASFKGWLGTALKQSWYLRSCLKAWDRVLHNNHEFV